METEDITTVIRACLTLPLIAARNFVRVREGAGGRIIFIGSYAHRHPFTNGTAYCAAKAGIEMATKTLAWELTAQDFAVMCVHPYHVTDTPMWKEVQDGVMKARSWTREEADEYADQNIKVRDLETGGPRHVQAQDVARVVRHLVDEPHDALLLRSGSSVEMFGGVR
jgi:NAD(P)-dependent dehydrogenase (short-subunit alcohol dehydrogenase family)